jgi:Mn2+/Fe2+ NRAMP family transporter
MALMMMIVTNPRAMGHLTLARGPAMLGWAATAVMAVASLVFFASLL